MLRISREREICNGIVTNVPGELSKRRDLCWSKQHLINTLGIADTRGETFSHENTGERCCFICLKKESYKPCGKSLRILSPFCFSCSRPSLRIPGVGTSVS